MSFGNCLTDLRWLILCPQSSFYCQKQETPVIWDSCFMLQRLSSGELLWNSLTVTSVYIFATRHVYLVQGGDLCQKAKFRSTCWCWWERFSRNVIPRPLTHVVARGWLFYFPRDLFRLIGLSPIVGSSVTSLHAKYCRYVRLRLYCRYSKSSMAMWSSQTVE